MIHRGNGNNFEVKGRADGEIRDTDVLSSGECELLSVAIEILSFSYQADHPDNAERKSLLLLDEPDVHLHPDLQHRLMNLLVEATHGKPTMTVIATHSTALLGPLTEANAHVAFMSGGDADIVFTPITQTLRDIIPVFGAHPLSNVFNERPILLVEGEDDVRIWQQVVRTSRGRISIWPCAAGDVQSLSDYENTVSRVIQSVYDSAQAFSLRDRDGAPYDIDDEGSLIRCRLGCRNAENLILSDDVLVHLGTTWADFQQSIVSWIRANPNHPQAGAMGAFAANFERKSADVKELRNLFVAIVGTSKPWEVAVGQAIAELNAQSSREDGSLGDFLGPKLVDALGLCR